MYFNLFLRLFVILMTISRNRSDMSCRSIIPDAITQIQNETIVIFQDKKVWFLKLQPKGTPNELSGPCPIKQIFQGMEGPIDAAVTFETHESVTEFLGASLYFTKGKFFTFRNLRPYQVEWGDLIYLPVKGVQAKMGISGKDASELMPTRMSAAFFDVLSSRSKFIFPDGRVLGYNFELGSEFDKPVVTDVDKELNKFGISIDSKRITASLTLLKSKQLVFFEGPVFCNFSYDLLVSANNKQKCLERPVYLFLDCDNIKQKAGDCSEVPPISEPEPTDQLPIVVADDRKVGSEEDPTQIRNNGPNGSNETVVAEITTDVQTLKPTDPPNFGSVVSIDCLWIFCSLILNYYLLFLAINTLF